MATNSADYCMLFSEWASSKLIRLEVNIGSVLESSKKKRCLKSFKTLVSPVNTFLETIAVNLM